jgi:hypothetical protein
MLQFDGYVRSARAQLLIWAGRMDAAVAEACEAGRIAERYRYVRDQIRSARLHGSATFSVTQTNKAEEPLLSVLHSSRRAFFVEEEIRCATELSRLYAKTGRIAEAREMLHQVWEPVERGPYPLFHADALNVLAQIEIDEQRQNWRDAAIEAATKAYKLAWCDGISADGKTCYAYHYGLTNAKKLLAELGAPEPQLPPFDESKFEPLPDVDLNPKDEFWVDPDSLDLPPDASSGE